MLKYSYDRSGNALGGTLEVVQFPPQITGHPVKQVAAPGEIVTFSVVVANAHEVTFQWKFNGIDIPGATGDSLLLTNVSAANEGQYSVVATNAAGSVTSDPAALTLRRNPSISTSTPPLLAVYSDAGGSVSITPLKPNYDPGETVTLTATPLTDRVFAGWIGDLNGSDNPATLVLNGNKTLRARFASTHVRLTAYSSSGGSVMVTPMKLSYDVGETVTLTALPDPQSVFLGWTGDLKGTDDPATLTMDKNKTVRARFASAASLPLGLIALWRGETDASDLIGGHHGDFFAGTEIIAPSVTDSGKVGGAFNFDGTKHVEVRDSAALRPAQLTVEAWVVPTEVPNGRAATIIARGITDKTWDLRLGDSKHPAVFARGGQDLEGPSAIPLNEWTHLAITLDGFIKRLYVNGAQVASNEQLGALLYEATLPITIGSDFQDGKSGNHFHGLIDEVALYNRALTADEVRSIYDADFLGKNFSQPYFTSPSQLPDAVLGANYSHQLTTLFGTPPLIFSLLEGLLPVGMTLSPAGLVSGVPSMRGVFDFAARATDATGAFTEQMCMLRVL